MGVYYTCEICGKSEKGMWPCDCPEKETNRNIQRRIKCRILVAFQAFDGANWYLYEELKDNDNGIVHMRICLGGASGEYEDHWKIVIIDEYDFDEHHDLYRLDELQKAGKVWTIKGEVDPNGVSYTVTNLDPPRSYSLGALPLEDRFNEAEIENFRQDRQKDGWTKSIVDAVEVWRIDGKVWSAASRCPDNETKKVFTRLQPGEWNDIFFVDEEMDEIFINYQKSGWTVAECTDERIRFFKAESTKEATVINTEIAPAIEVTPKKNKNSAKKRRQRQNRKLREQTEKRQHENEQTRGRMQFHCTAVRSPPVPCTRILKDGDSALCSSHSRRLAISDQWI